MKMINMPFFSVIIPAYNSEKYIRKGLDSIKTQTFTDYELIIVCDSCTDETEKIAHEYTNKVYKSTYGSAGGSRNIGLDHAQGEWILFMDDDDWWLHEYAFDILAKKCKNTSDDIVAFSFIYRGSGYATCSKEWIAVWNKAWRRSFINSKPYRFPETLLWDDVKFHYDIKNIARYTLWDMPLYYYNYGREGSVTVRKERGELREQEAAEHKQIYGY